MDDIERAVNSKYCTNVKNANKIFLLSEEASKEGSEYINEKKVMSC